MNFEKYVSLLKSGLFCPKSSLFEDQWEGLIAPKVAQNDQEYIDHFSKAREWVYVSCWHSESAESYAMWKIYGGHRSSVCIATTEVKLKELFSKYLAPAIYSCKVGYESPGGLKREPTVFSILKEDINFVKKVSWSYATNHSVKHNAYSFEEEYRFMVIDEQFSLRSQNESQGITLKIEPKEIIESVIVSPGAPEWFFEVVSDISSKYGLTIDVQKSDLELRVRS